jgi:hypothetical protein
VTAKKDYYRIAYELVDGIVAHCLPVWFPRLGVILYVAGLGLSVTHRAFEHLTSARG